MTSSQRIWFNTVQAAEYGSCNPQTVANACRSGALRAGQPGGERGRWRIHRDDLDAWLRGERAESVVRSLPAYRRANRSA